jgi:membrane-associated HD superfamily phosphohydrolase
LATNKKQNKKKKEAKKLYELQKKYGTITMELYNNYLNELNNMKPTFELNTAEIAHKNHIQNIIKLYLKQQRNNEQTNEINIDLSELSDLSNSD